jgi:hypothetical protein
MVKAPNTTIEFRGFEGDGEPTWVRIVPALVVPYAMGSEEEGPLLVFCDCLIESHRVNAMVNENFTIQGIEIFLDSLAGLVSRTNDSAELSGVDTTLLLRIERSDDSLIFSITVGWPTRFSTAKSVGPILRLLRSGRLPAYGVTVTFPIDEREVKRIVAATVELMGQIRTIADYIRTEYGGREEYA